MKAKIIGLGKCGSRLTYDFFAYISQTPTAYEIRERPRGKFLDYLTEKVPAIGQMDKWFRESGLNTQKLLQQMFGEFLIYDPVILVTVDSDTTNNEITSWITFLNEQGKKFVFPGKAFTLADHRGGCEYHILSETICKQWFDIDREIVSDEDADFLVTAFSVGGGTGGGAAPIISQKCKQYRSKNRGVKTEQIHFMGVGILPTSDQMVYAGEELPDMVASERYNTGRFFTNLYGRRNTENPELYMDGVWLFSNDILRVVSNNSHKQKEELNLSSINTYFSASLTVICNASSKRTKSQPNFDPSEMNSRLNGYPFISGYASVPTEQPGDENIITNLAKNIVKLALNNPTLGKDSQLYGLSLPVLEADLEEVNRVLNVGGLEKYKATLSTYKLEKSPLEFRTASTVVVIYGQPQNKHSPSKDQLVFDTISTLFPNSDVECYYYKTPSGTLDTLLVLIVNPFIRFIQKSIYYYTDTSWVKHMASEELDELFDDIILEKPFDSEKLGNVLLQKEQLLSNYHGENIIQLMESFQEPQYLKREYVINAFNHLHQTYHHKKITSQRRSRI